MAATMNDLAIIDREHARISPSGFERVEKCTMSVPLSAQAPPEEDSPAAIAGTAQHTIAELCLIQDLDTLELHDLKTIKSRGRQVEVTQSMLDAVQHCLDWLRTCDLLEGRTLEYEQTLHLPFVEQYLGEPMYGYADVLARDLPCVVVDFKFGFNPVRADSVQLGLYVLAAVLEQTNGSLHGEGLAGTAVVLQPNERDGDPKVHEWTYAALRELRDRVIAVCRRVRRHDYTYGFGEHCRYCKAARMCPHLAATARDFALTQVAPTPEMVASGEVTSDMLDEWYSTLQVVDHFAKQFMRTFEDYLVHGGHSKVAKLVRKRANRRWKDDAAAAALIEQLGADPWVKKLVSPAEAERRVPRAKLDLIHPLTEKPQGELTVADIDDPKEGVDVGASLKAALASSAAAGYLEAAKSRAEQKEEGR